MGESSKSDQESFLLGLVESYMTEDAQRYRDFTEFAAKKGQEMSLEDLDRYYERGLSIYEHLKWKTDWPVRIFDALIYFTQVSLDISEENTCPSSL
jgi:hypothetical protein